MASPPDTLPRSVDARGLNARQVNLLLEILFVVVVATGLISWGVGTGWARWWTVAHAIAGLGLVVLTPAKIRGSVRAGLRRRRWTRWLSMSFGLVILATVASGLLHASGLWHGVGYWTPLWTHFLLAFAAVPLFAWHLWSRPAKVRTTDLDRRLLIRSASTLGLAAAVVGGVEVLARSAGLDGGRRRFTGSHEIASFDPSAMPVVSWINDATPKFDVHDVDRPGSAKAVGSATWSLSILGLSVSFDDLVAAARPLPAVLDCTGGWWSAQEWDVVPLSALLGEQSARSFVARSHTGYTRTFPMSDADVVYLAVGYGGTPLKPGHGAPVRIVAPGRRGPWWVKWVVSIEASDRPWWAQLPFPAT